MISDKHPLNFWLVQMLTNLNLKILSCFKFGYATCHVLMLLQETGDPGESEVMLLQENEDPDPLDVGESESEEMLWKLTTQEYM